MSRVSTISLDGKWFKGNTHAHTCLSDGVLKPDELVLRYANMGYSFTAITDHRLYGVHENLNRPDFLVLPGVELDVGLNGHPTFCHHLIGLGLPRTNTLRHGQIIDYPANTTTEHLISFLKKHGNLCIYAHPSWSHAEPNTLESLPDLFGMEIYNTNCEVHAACGRSEAWYDQILWNGKSIWCIASDDTHQNRPDIGGGFIMVKANSLTHQDISDALIAGSFYASEAPLIYDFSITDGQANLSCSPCQSVGFLTNIHPGSAENNPEGHMQEAVYNLRGDENYLRAVCTDSQGRRAWTQPIKLS